MTDGYEQVSPILKDTDFLKGLVLSQAVSLAGNALRWDAQMINSAFKNQSNDYAGFLSTLVIDIGDALVGWLSEGA